MKRVARLVVLISGNGSNLQAILDAIRNGSLPAEVVAVISNKSDAYGLERARAAGIPAVVKTKGKDQDRATYDAELAVMVTQYHPDWIVLAGWMRILGMSFLEKFQNRVVNLHPALPGTFAGVNAIERAFEAYRRGEIQYTGVMVHLIPDDGVDCGPILNQRRVDIHPKESLAELEQKIHAVEHELLVQTIKQLIEMMEEQNA
jgi:phosphoribosylglycinamide formyltransferase 1